ncbi:MULTISPECIES: porin [unclassified Shewanella]|uniref:porin n=1 Tax=unclassified Shewanella TaxID=196818 RepID=UPI000C814FF4|nr:MULTISPECIES: porin [unclassified Shewanella]MDO6618669.1 porin [Shewanella sp. 6_MG-2023]MDO6641172.1 porin [Shewanella sp. 5_MG-2023]MDO6774674.1 porin [Shewanella sp. 3_MG-2023]PMG31969.1 porin [Shewanella sp. 10N.286.52.C2]PMG49853.1 porin [Shewanella sp. 10N.286.52.B9]
MMNTFYKTLVASAIAAATLSTAQAAEPLEIYGKLNVSIQSNDDGSGSETRVQSNASRFGVKGAFELNSSLEAFYTIEYEVATDSDSSNNFKARNQFVGLKGDFGSFAVGRNDTMLKKSQGKVDQFGDYSGDLKNLFAGENRIAETATYLTPKFGDFQAGVTYAASGDSKQADEDGFSIAAMYGDSGLKKTPIYASVAYDAEVAGYDIVRGTVQGKVAGFVLGGMYQQEEKVDSGDSKDGYLLSAAYKIDSVTLKAQYQDMEDKGDSWSIGADYSLGKPTKLFAFYTDRTSMGTVEDADGNDMDISIDESYFAVGIEHKF